MNTSPCSRDGPAPTPSIDRLIHQTWSFHFQECWSIKYKSVNTHPHQLKGQYHCTSHPLFNWLGFDQTSKAVANSTQESKQNQQEVSRSTVIPPLKLVFSVQTFGFSESQENSSLLFWILASKPLSLYAGDSFMVSNFLRCFISSSSGGWTISESLLSASSGWPPPSLLLLPLQMKASLLKRVFANWSISIKTGVYNVCISINHGSVMFICLLKMFIWCLHLY